MDAFLIEEKENNGAKRIKESHVTRRTSSQEQSNSQIQISIQQEMTLYEQMKLVPREENCFA